MFVRSTFVLAPCKDETVVDPAHHTLLPDMDRDNKQANSHGPKEIRNIHTDMNKGIVVSVFIYPHITIKVTANQHWSRWGCAQSVDSHSIPGQTHTGRSRGCMTPHIGLGGD